ncbi:MAG: DUF3467 domain-containing protein [Chitinophagales bacterium]|nr:DUF3467 domain-containing protein [Chitinophagales bacterium]HNI44367.1 DUF3467 domain-containing protein [Chitinophagales bacterium]HNL08480.1 DUF3467 domain-containing protein [Chitinophagales bacterium]
MENPQNPNQINIELTEDIAEGVYANLAVISHSTSEFVIDFIKIMPGMPKAKVKSRVVLTPQHAKRLLKAIADNIRKYEQLHGEIIDPSQHNDIPPTHFFGGPPTQA